MEVTALDWCSIVVTGQRRGVDHIGVGVGAIIVDDAGRLFLARRGPAAKNERGLWEFPGGSVELGERLADALRREMREEYGVEIAVGDLLDVVDHLLPGEGQHWVSPTFVCRVVSGTPVIREPAKCSAIGWFAVDQVPAELTVISRENLAHYRARLARSTAPVADAARPHSTPPVPLSTYVERGDERPGS